ncbi:major facilitator superfamily protein [Actinidia rufa]|uniref:Major facilitator superfamily protein n=1 Tax=Actinidia rufa TaxID=165716 RepID=A0A7J0H6Y7_9ERIC|nr:major facilitator superfamily protein [Actinidia rufa]
MEESFCASKFLLGHRQDTLDDKFWLMTFTESASFIGSQVISNWLVLGKTETSILSPSTATVLLAILSIILVAREWKEVPQPAASKDYRIYFSAYIFGGMTCMVSLSLSSFLPRDKRVWLLAWAQACIQFSIAVFWILWAPTIVADGREVQLGLIYPCLLGARMLGSTAFPWFFSGPLSLRTEDCLVYVFIVMGFVLSIVAYDYQEIGVLVTLFCLFHACVGLVLPSIARLRTMYVPNELRGGMISLSLAPANAAIIFLLLQFEITMTEIDIVALLHLVWKTVHKMLKERENLTNN